jgi:hypothetical protein
MPESISDSDLGLEPETRHQWLSYQQSYQIYALKFIAGWTYSKIAETIELPICTIFQSA